MDVELDELLDTSLLQGGWLPNDDIIHQSTITAEDVINPTLKPSASAPNRNFVPVTNSELEYLKQSRIPLNTVRRVKWAMKLFRSWHGEWKTRLDSSLKVLKDIEEMTLDEIDYCLQHFIPEIRKENGELYPPKTYKEIISSIQHYLNNTLNMKCSIFTDKIFMECRKVIDAQMKKAASLGKAVPPKRSHSISFEDENRLWEIGAFGCSDPKQLLDTLIYHLGIHLSLRACQEHRDLIYGPESQLKLVESESESYIEYTERISKSKRFGLKDVRREPKTTRIYPNSQNPDRCVVRLYELYLSKRPETHGQKGNTAFYLTPKASIEGPVWYKCIPLGVHSIEKTTSRLMAKIKTSESSKSVKYSNSSLRRTSQMRLLQAKIPSEIIQKKSGRISSMATQAYIESELYEVSMSDALYCKNQNHEQNRASQSTSNSIQSDQMPQCIFSGNPQFYNCTFNINQ